jgi:hypothetical protein
MDHKTKNENFQMGKCFILYILVSVKAAYGDKANATVLGALTIRESNTRQDVCLYWKKKMIYLKEQSIYIIQKTSSEIKVYINLLKNIITEAQQMFTSEMILTAVTMRITDFQGATVYILVDITNAGNDIPDYTASHPQKLVTFKSTGVQVCYISQDNINGTLYSSHLGVWGPYLTRCSLICPAGSSNVLLSSSVLFCGSFFDAGSRQCVKW